MGGKLEVKSIEDEGSEFYFTLETELRDNETIKAIDISNIKRCLIIGDNQNSKTIIEDILKAWNIKSITCDNGFESLKVIENNEAFDVIFCEYQMSYLNGLETVKMIREKLKLPPQKSPIILLHSLTDDSEIEKKSKELGIFFKLIKPLKQDELLNCLSSIHQGNFQENVDNKIKKVIKKEKSNVVNYSSFRVLIVEDNLNNMLLASSLIKRVIPNVELIKAENGKVALDKIISLKPDLVFMDVQMPEMDGNESTFKLREYESKKNIKRTIVVGLTA
jgi:CheY-like chemotaxis protein